MDFWLFLYNLQKKTLIFDTRLGSNWGQTVCHMGGSVILRTRETLENVMFSRAFLIAGMGFEPHDLRVMSPTSYQAALPRDINFLENGSDAGDRARTGTGLLPRDFKSRASACSATPAYKASRSLECLYIIADVFLFVNTFLFIFFISPVFPEIPSLSFENLLCKSKLTSYYIDLKPVLCYTFPCKLKTKGSLYE